MPNAILKGRNTAAEFWSTRREASLNWLALGLLLAAWNASNNDAAADAQAAVRNRPEALRGYAKVSVRAANRAADLQRQETVTEL
ncbi:MAG TPA: hypothetical protein VK794_03545 [Steroidobacteraceae bacterium]|nr:hypothetical protein [Steroidobacteraceae bacterium]